MREHHARSVRLQHAHTANVNNSLQTAVQSVYLWEGKVEDSTESLLMIKTRDELKKVGTITPSAFARRRLNVQAQELTSFVEKEHSYDVPEVIFADITDGSKPYLSWVIESTKEPSDAKE